MFRSLLYPMSVCVLIRRFFWFLVGVILAAMPMFAYALTEYNAVPAPERWIWSGTNGQYSSLSSCQASGIPIWESWYPGYTCPKPGTWSSNEAGTSYQYSFSQCSPVAGGAGWCTKAPTTYSCPYGGMLQASTAKCTEAPDCPAGQERGTDGACQVPPCEAGSLGTMRFDIGYTATGGSSAVDWIGSPSPPDLNKGYCDGQCRVGIGSPLGCWKSTEGPPYVAYCSYETTKTGSTCSTSDVPPPTLDPIPCPSGTAPGAVNGVGGCYPVSETVTETAPPVPNPDGSSTTTTTTTNPDGTQTITSETTHPDGSKTVTVTTGPGPGTGTGGGEGGEGGEGSEPVEFPAECVSDPSKCEDKTGKFEKGDKGTFDLAAANQEKQAALEALFEKWDEIREEMGEVWGGVNESNGSLPCLAQFMFLGTEVKMCMKPEWVDWLPKLVLLIAAIIAAFILFRE